MARRMFFHRDLYLPEAVEATAGAYRDHARITLRRDESGMLATFSEADADDPVVFAFCNHALFETVRRRREAGRLEGS